MTAHQGLLVLEVAIHLRAAQVTDAYLAQLARGRGARLATFDQALAKLHDDVADFVPDT